MAQSKKDSVIESIVGTSIAFCISTCTMAFIVSPLFSLKTNFGEDIAITAIFTVISIVRSYVVRRLFNLKELRKMNFPKEIPDFELWWAHFLPEADRYSAFLEYSRIYPEANKHGN